MNLKNKDEPKNQLPKTPADAGRQNNITIESRLEEMETLPHRNAALHWSAFTIALLSLILLASWVFSSRGAVPSGWVWIDISLSVFLTIGFFTRSGFRKDPAKYLRTRFFGIFDLVAIIPALALVHHGFVLENAWVWIMLLARALRVIDRFLGDGFVQRNALALLEGIEESITDMVLGRIIARIQTNMVRTSFSKRVAEAFIRNKPAVLKRVRAATPHDGLLPGLAHIAGLDTALERAEERTYDAIVEILNSQEVDDALRDVIETSFGRMRSELGKKEWRRHLGIRSLTAK
jgi:hypothetical protein